MKLIKGFNDTLSILAFKWRMLSGPMAKLWIVVGAAAVGFLIFMAANLGTFVKQMLSQMPDSGSEKQTFLIFLKVFIDNSSGLMLGGMFWAILLGAVVMPLIGFKFGTLIPDGDLVGVTRNNNHQLSDSIFLQMLSSISLVQIISLTALVSLFTVDVDSPGYAILATWGLWLVSSLFSVLSIWFLDWALRKYGIKSKFIALGTLAAVIGVLLLLDFENTLNFFGLAPKYIEWIQSLNSSSLDQFAAWSGILFVVCVVLISLISFMGTKALSLPELSTRKNQNVPMLARLGLDKMNFISSMTQFITNTVLQQPNILKPLLIGLVFTVGLSLGLSGMTTVPVLTSVMVSLAWTVNVFGVFGSGTTWLLSIYEGKEKLLGSILRVHHFTVLFISAMAGVAVSVFKGATISELILFVLSSMAVSLTVGHASLRRSIYNPHRFRVNVKGESIIPPAQAIVTMFHLFAVGFLTLGFMYIVPSLLPNNALYSIVMPFISFGAVVIMTIIRYRNLKREWLSNDDIVKNIIKQVGV